MAQRGSGEGGDVLVARRAGGARALHESHTARVVRVEVMTAKLPFRFSFGHALAQRRSSENVYVRLTLEGPDGAATGYGEGVPREYVTGETVESATRALCERYVPAALGRQVCGADEVPAVLEEVAAAGSSGNGGLDLAAWCALELAFLDAAGRLLGQSVGRWLGGAGAPADVTYDAVIPLLPPPAMAPLAAICRLAGYARVKLKVGQDLAADLKRLRVLRRILGPRVDLRVDANCAWTADEALAALARMRRYGISAAEQPVAADDLDGLRRVTAGAPEMVIADEALRTVEEAAELARTRACDAFNIRVSKCGGLLNSRRIARIAADAGLACVVGAQVGESGLLSAAGRHLAASLPSVRYVEGSAGRLLLREDLTEENVLPGWAGRARSFVRPGLGVRVKETTLDKYAAARRVFEAPATAPAIPLN
ncbi:MAG TPA: enolase C-terminal domain-like protein [Chloroflexota bacterium]|nr:enolase C-terminal domain-like protein [Chloroflexota bacterium]